MRIFEKVCNEDSLCGAGSVLNCKNIYKIIAKRLGELKHIALSLRYNIRTAHNNQSLNLPTMKKVTTSRIDRVIMAVLQSSNQSAQRAALWVRLHNLRKQIAQ